MFIAHIGAGLAAKRVAPRVNLAVLITAGVLLDLVWPVLVLAGVERVQVEHGLAMWLFVALAFWADRHRMATAIARA